MNSNRRVEVRYAYLVVALDVFDGSGVVNGSPAIGAGPDGRPESPCETHAKTIVLKVPDEAILDPDAFTRAFELIGQLRKELAAPETAPVSSRLAGMIKEARRWFHRG